MKRKCIKLINWLVKHWLKLFIPPLILAYAIISLAPEKFFIYGLSIILLMSIFCIAIIVLKVIAEAPNKYKIIKIPHFIKPFDTLLSDFKTNLQKKGYTHLSSYYLLNNLLLSGYAKPVSTHIFDLIFIIKAETITLESSLMLYDAIMAMPKANTASFKSEYRHRYSLILCLDNESKTTDKLLKREQAIPLLDDFFVYGIRAKNSKDDEEFIDKSCLDNDQAFQPIVVNLTDKKVSIPYRITKKGKEITCSIRDELLEIMNIDTSIHRHTIANGNYHEEQNKTKGGRL